MKDKNYTKKVTPVCTITQDRMDDCSEVHS